MIKVFRHWMTEKDHSPWEMGNKQEKHYNLPSLLPLGIFKTTLQKADFMKSGKSEQKSPLNNQGIL